MASTTLLFSVFFFFSFIFSANYAARHLSNTPEMISPAASPSDAPPIHTVPFKPFKPIMPGHQWPPFPRIPFKPFKPTRPGHPWSPMLPMLPMPPPFEQKLIFPPPMKKPPCQRKPSDKQKLPKWEPAWPGHMPKFALPPFPATKPGDVPKFTMPPPMPSVPAGHSFPKNQYNYMPSFPFFSSPPTNSP